MMLQDQVRDTDAGYHLFRAWDKQKMTNTGRY